MRYTVVMSDKLNSTRRRGVSAGTVHNPTGIGLRKEGEPREAKLDSRIPVRIRELLERRKRDLLNAGKIDASLADAIIEAVDIAQASGWRKPTNLAPAED